MKEQDHNNSNMCSDPSEKALARYAAVSWIVEKVKESHLNSISLSRIINDASSKNWNSYHFASSTLERYYYQYKKSGFACLNDKKRSDEGCVRKLTDDQLQLLLAERRAKRDLPVTVLLDMLKDKGHDFLSTISMSSVYRIFNENNLDAKSLQNGYLDPLSGPQKTFEMPAVNMLWMTDMMFGPSLKSSKNKLVKTRLFALLDDHSRLCVGAQYFESESLDCFLVVLRQAILRRGVPDKIYTDRGKIYMSNHLASICANMGIKLSHARPYHAWSKGKIERFFRTVQMQFQTQLTYNPIHSIDELNSSFHKWLEDKYHRNIHSATDQAPAKRFSDGVQGIRNPPSEGDLESLFMKRINRRVRKDACIAVEAKLFEAPLCLRGMKVEVRHSVPLSDHIEIWHNQHLAGIGKPINKHVNSTNFKRRKQ